MELYSGHTWPGAFCLRKLGKISSPKDRGENSEPRVRQTRTAPAMRDQAPLREV